MGNTEARGTHHCSKCGSTGHNIRTCERVHRQIAEEVVKGLSRDMILSIVCAGVDAHFGGMPVTQTLRQVVNCALDCRSIRGWNGLSSSEKKRFILEKLAENFFD